MTIGARCFATLCDQPSRFTCIHEPSYSVTEKYLTSIDKSMGKCVMDQALVIFHSLLASNKLMLDMFTHEASLKLVFDKCISSDTNSMSPPRSSSSPGNSHRSLSHRRYRVEEVGSLGVAMGAQVLRDMCNKVSSYPIIHPACTL